MARAAATGDTKPILRPLLLPRIEGQSEADYLLARRRIYRARVRPDCKWECETCGRRFRWYHGKDGNGPRRFCSKKCYGVEVSRRRRRILLSPAELEARYWALGGSLKKLAQELGVRHTSVWAAMRKHGIRIRPTGQNHEAATRCVVPGCESPLELRRLPNGKLWGNRCLDHLREYCRQRTARYEARKRRERST